jgi:hypothetical protein
LIYQVVPSATAKDPVRFAGVVSFDGSSNSISGQGETKPTISIRSFRRIAAGQFELLVTGPPQARYSVQASSNLLDWTAVTTVTSNGSSLIFTDPEPNDAARFYQAVLIP